MQHSGGQTRVLLACKHTDRAKNHCPEPLRVRPHKRGHLTAECAAGHQWVWCPLCCTCDKLGTNGCHQATHWIERDCYDTGKRNHMQRHSPCQVPTSMLEAVALPEVCTVCHQICCARSVLECLARAADFVVTPGRDCCAGGRGILPPGACLPVMHCRAFPDGSPLFRRSSVPSATPAVQRPLQCRARALLAVYLRFARPWATRTCTVGNGGGTRATCAAWEILLHASRAPASSAS